MAYRFCCVLLYVSRYTYTVGYGIVHLVMKVSVSLSKKRFLGKFFLFLSIEEPKTK